MTIDTTDEGRPMRKGCACSSDRATRLVALCLMLLPLRSLPAQTPVSSRPSFEVVSIKPSKPDAVNSNLNLGLDHFTTQSITLTYIIQFAYNLNSGSEAQIVGAPAWVHSSPFDINAKGNEELTAQYEKMPLDQRTDVLRAMVQALLADRFHLEVHNETRELSVLALGTTKSGSKLKRAVEPIPDASAAAPSGWRGLHNNGAGEIEGRGATLDMLVNVLGSQPDIGGRMVVDNTGLSGAFDFSLHYTPDRASGSGGDDTGRPSLFSALQEQLGLKLEGKKLPVRVLVIDNVEKPSEN